MLCSGTCGNSFSVSELHQLCSCDKKFCKDCKKLFYGMSILITLKTTDVCNMCKGTYIIPECRKFESIKYAIERRVRSFHRGASAKADEVMDLAVNEARRHGFAEVEDALGAAIYIWLEGMEEQFNKGAWSEYVMLVESTMLLCSLKTKDICAVNRPIPLIE
jgi:hypothetical protein